MDAQDLRRIGHAPARHGKSTLNVFLFHFLEGKEGGVVVGFYLGISRWILDFRG